LWCLEQRGHDGHGIDTRGCASDAFFEFAGPAGASRSHKTQVGRALAQLGIEHIASYSPHARGRSERAFRTLQDRLPKELRLAGIDDVEAANRWLREHFISEYNNAFAIAPEQDGTAFVADRAEAWHEILCVIEERTVGNDNTIAWAKQRLRKPAASALRQGPRPRPPIPRQQRERVPRPAPVGQLRRPRRAALQPDRLIPNNVSLRRRRSATSCSWTTPASWWG
jgi:hypothetical protein